MIILIIAFLGIFLLVSGRLYQANNYLKIVKYSAPLGFPAIIAGWITAEVGRQPWVIYDYLRTSAAVSNVSLYHLIVSLALIIIVYGIIFGIFYFRYFARIVATGPAKIEEPKMPFAYLHGSEGETKNVHS